MAFPFEPRGDLVTVRAALFGPKAIVGLILALDTGSTQTVIAPHKLKTAGYDLGSFLTSVSVATGSQIEVLPVLRINSLGCLGEIRDNFEVLAHDLPASPRVHGVLGLDFLRERRLILDFRGGEIELV